MHACDILTIRTSGVVSHVTETKWKTRVLCEHCRPGVGFLAESFAKLPDFHLERTCIWNIFFSERNI